jgi:hypothetical protein
MLVIMMDGIMEYQMLEKNTTMQQTDSRASFVCLFAAWGGDMPRSHQTEFEKGGGSKNTRVVSHSERLLILA